MEIEDVLRTAIAERRVVSLTYRKGAGAARIVHPHVLFRTRDGELCVDGLQTGGYSSGGPLPAWRQFKLADIETASLEDTTFELADGFAPGGQKYANGILIHAPR
jgi:WYL domain